MMLIVACLASGVVDQMPVNKWDLNSTCLLSTLSLYLLHSVFVPTYMCVSVFVCKSLWVCVCDCVTGGRPVGGKMQEVCLSVSTCIRRSMFFPFKGEVSCVCMCVRACVFMYVADHVGRLTSRNPCSKNRHCVFPALAHHYHRTHTHAYTDHCPILFSLAGFLNAYPCASGCQDVSLWLSWENLLSGSKLENTNRRGVTASSQLCHFFWPH